MVCSGVLGFILHFLFHPVLGIDNLKNIINHINQNYGDNNQYAVGINVPDKYCGENADLDNNFLGQEDAEKVKNAMAGPDRIYKGYQLIAAKPKPIANTEYNYYSEYLLLINSMSAELAQYDPLMKTLLTSDPEGCTVFFTMNSTCVVTCSDPKAQHSIIPALKMFKDHKGPKAFVFNQVLHHDINKEQWEKNIKLIHEKIPVYRCDSNQCILCVNNDDVDKRCLQKNPHG